MILTQAVWDKITITYDEETKGPGRTKWNSKEEVWRGAQLFYKKEGGLCTLRVRKGDKSIFLIRAKVLEITPWSAKFEAHFWSSKPDSNEYEYIIRADIVCEF